jgi:hypothetical protein
MRAYREPEVRNFLAAAATWARRLAAAGESSQATRVIEG